MDALERLARAVPANVREVCAKLVAAGHEAVTVGGAVRDTLLGRTPGDWDVATSALPDQVLAMFRHTKDTGPEHGTVTVVTGQGAETHVEVTTFRGDGSYSDARRPDHVVFGVPLVEDLARRDFVVNAIAYDPAKNALIDPFGGEKDLVDRRLRAVGTPVDRFTEDGLRVMRAVRFAAQLEFELDPDTELGIAPALPSLAKIARERVCIELRKLLEAREPSRGLVPAHRTGIVRTVLPELDSRLGDVGRWAGRVDRTARPARLAALLVPFAVSDKNGALDRDAVKQVAAILRALKFSNVEIDLAAQLVGVAHSTQQRAWTPTELRKLLATVDRDKRSHVIELWDAEIPRNTALIDLARTVLAEGHPLAVSDLAITGKDLMTALAMPPGPAIGRILAMLLERVLEDPARNTPDTLLAEARGLELELGR